MVSFLGQPRNGPYADVFSSDPLPTRDILAIDRLAVAAWPATHNDDRNGWLFRFANGVSRRANSVAPFPFTSDSISLDQQIAEAEAFYRGHGLPPRFQISPAAAPAGLDRLLAARGYATEAAVTIQIAPAPAIAALDDARKEISLSTTAPAGWWAFYAEGYDRDASAIAARACEQAVFATYTGDDGRPAAIGLGVYGGNWLGIFGMLTDPKCRNQGLGRALIRALAGYAVEQGAIGLYLQVENSNPDAARLYQRLGFRDVYGYHYRTLWTKS